MHFSDIVIYEHLVFLGNLGEYVCGFSHQTAFSPVEILITDFFGFKNLTLHRVCVGSSSLTKFVYDRPPLVYSSFVSWDNPHALIFAH